VSTTTAKPDAAELAVDRTWLAYERTLMAWVRTATSMISFGFSIYKFFQFEKGEGERRASGFFTPRDFSIFLVSIALIALFTAAIGHRKAVRKLTPYLSQAHHSQAEYLAALISVFGLMVLITAILHG
jgi:putative membrane protein